ncbi:hypothetical protein EYF80_058899 [Liparis tanakae]|uniref:Uncharacterized protein n=1 Tax=Liparis tanakae TaxID=230148 RepID=A0A4Z2EQ75_9TELE|nr:hypothetical protein EYF80_058899 [Liparis tanakae]
MGMPGGGSKEMGIFFGFIQTNLDPTLARQRRVDSGTSSILQLRELVMFFSRVPSTRRPPDARRVALAPRTIIDLCPPGRRQLTRPVL